MTGNSPSGASHTATPPPEPFIGPRPFQERDRDFFFGREHEAIELASLITAHPLMLLYAQSGAGKTSLLNASLIAMLRTDEIEVLPVARVRGKEGEAREGAGIKNIYVYNALRYLAGGDISAEQLPRLTLAGYLQTCPRLEGEEGAAPRVVIFDQFEELFTLYPERYEDRQQFFAQVREALKADPLLHVLFSMREDYIAELDPYTPTLPEKLQTRLRLERLRRDSALEAVTGPLEAAPLAAERRSFAPGVAERLVDNLLAVRVKTVAGEREVAGEFVEPLQLQVVCQTIWDNLQLNERVITAAHLEKYGDVNEALSSFYERCLQRAVEAANKVKTTGPPLTEGVLRGWFERVLITPDLTRSTVFRGYRSDKTAGIPNSAVDELERQRILRMELRGGEPWYELGHDRFIQPIRESNKKWLLRQPLAVRRGQELEARASDWVRAGRDRALLLPPDESRKAKLWLASPEAQSIGYTDTLYSYVEASAAALQQQRNKRVTQAVAALLVLILMMGGLLVFALDQKRTADQQRNRAETALQAVTIEKGNTETALATANKAREEEEKQRKNAEEQGRLAKLAVEGEAAERRKAEAARDLVNATNIELASLAQTLRLTNDELATKNTQLETQTEKLNDLTKLLVTQNEELVRARDKANSQVKQLKEQTAKLNKLTNELEKQNKVLDVARNNAYSRALAAHAIGQLEIDPERSLLLSIEAAKVQPVTTEAEDALRMSLTESHQRAVIPVSGATKVGELRGATFLGDGRVLNVSRNGKLQTIDPKTNQTQETQLPNVPPLATFDKVAFSDDGRGLASILSDTSVRMWRIGTGEGLLTVHDDKQQSDQLTTAVALSPDHKYVATGLLNGLVQVADAQTGQVVMELPAQTTANTPPSTVTSIRIVYGTSAQDGVHSMDDIFVLAGFKDGAVRAWDLTPPEPGKGKFPRFTYHAHTGGINGLATGVGDIIATAGQDGLARIILDPGGDNDVTELRGHSGPVNDVAFSSDDAFVVTAGEDATARVWDVKQGEVVAVLRGHSGPVKRASFSPDGLFVVTTGQDNTTRLWTYSMDTLPATLSEQKNIIASTAAFSPDAKYLAAAQAGTAYVWEVATGRQHSLLQHEKSVTTIGFSHDGKRIVTTSYDNTIQLWRLGEQNPVILRGHEAAVVSATFNRDDSLLVTTSYDGTARVWRVGPQPESLHVLRAGFQTAVSSDLASLGVDARPMQNGALTPYGVLNAAFSPDGKYVVTAGADKTACVWDAATGARLTPDASVLTLDAVMWHTDEINSATFSPDGRYIVTASRDKTARVWDVGQWQRMQKWSYTELRGHLNTLGGAIFSPDNKLVLTWSEDSTTRIWDPDTGRTWAVLRDPTQRAISAVFGPDGKQIITSSQYGTVRSYACDVCGSVDELKALAVKRAATRSLNDAERKKFYIEPNR
jgi:WD40 repeat protein